MKKIICLFLALGFFTGLFFPGSAFAQNPDYKIQPTDVLNITYFRSLDEAFDRLKDPFFLEHGVNIGINHK